MKPTSTIHPIDLGSQNLPEPPAISRLKRVVDVKSLEPARVKSPHSTQDKKKHPTRRQTQDPSSPREATLPPKQATKPQQTAKSPQTTKTQQTVKTQQPPKTHQPKRIKATSAPTPQQDIPSVDAQPITPSATTPNPTPAQPQIRTPRIARSKSKTNLHVSELSASSTKNRVVLKSKKLSDRLHKSRNIPQIPETSLNLSEKIDEALMLQSWHAKQWSAGITTMSPSMQANLLKSMSLAQARLVNNLCITPGRLEATVFDQIVSISLRQFTPGQWRAVIDMLSDRAIFTTSLLNGELPEGILAIFKQASLSLFPTKIREFSFSCTCEPESSPCEHACALLLAFAQALDEDPFLILALRGMPRDQILSQIRDARSDQVVDEKNRHRINYEMPAQNINFETFFTQKGNFEDLNFHISGADNTLLRRLGSPDIWNSPISLENIITPIVRMASQSAERLGLIDFSEFTTEDSRPKSSSDKPRIESRAPKKVNKKQQFTMPNLDFVLTVLPQEILETVSGDPIETASDILKWLKTRGASDIRTLARRTRLHKTTIEAFLNAFSEAGLTTSEGDDEKLKFSATF